MAEDIRASDSDPRDLIEQRRSEIIAEAARQEESCLHTSTSLFIWLRWIRWQRQVFVIAPIILGGLAGLSVLQGWFSGVLTAVLAFAASLFPALADALKIETSVEVAAKAAADFKSLQDRFRRLAKITALGDVEAADAGLSELMDRLDVARSVSVTAPEWAFEAARKKIESGDYSFAVDLPKNPNDKIDGLRGSSSN